MAWTDERVARLTKLWADGLSASQIAADLGEVTRNAVIGKVHRLGLSGRVKANNTGGRPKRKATDDAQVTPMSGGARAAGMAASAISGAGATMGSHGSTGPTMSGGAPRSVGGAALKMEPEMDMATDAEPDEAEEVAPRFQEAEDVVVPMSKKLTLLQLNDATCKWPTGDPQRPGFSFCGHNTKDGTPYCDYHAKLAFQPPSERRRRR